MNQLNIILNAKEPPRWAVYIVATVLLISGCGTFYYWASLMSGNEKCVECVPFGLSTFRFLYWPMSDLFLDVLCFSTAFGLLGKWRFVYLSGVTLGFLFIFMAFLAWYMDLFVNDIQTQPQFLNAWFIGWGSFLLWFMHHWRGYWGSAASSSSSSLPTQRKRGAI